MTGVPEITPADVAEIVLGAPVIAKVIASSTSAKLPEISTLYAASSAVLASAIALETVGASLSAETVMTTVSVTALLVPSVTETWKVVVYCAVPSAAVNVGAAALVLERVCAVPLDTLHEYVRDSDSGSELPAALSVTDAPSATD